MGRSKEKIRQRNRRAKVRRAIARNRLENRPTQLPKAALPDRAQLQVLHAAYRDFQLAGQALEQQHGMVGRDSSNASSLMAAAESYRDKTNLMVLGCLQQSLVRHKPTGKQYNFFGRTLAAIMEHDDPARWGTPFRHQLDLRLKPSRTVQRARQTASMPASPSKSASALGAALLRQFNTPPHQLKRTWFSNRGG